MELCPFEDAFPNIDTRSVHKRLGGGEGSPGSGPSSGSGFPYVGGTDSKPSREERRAARKMAKRAKGPAIDYSNQITADLPPDSEVVVGVVGGMASTSAPAFESVWYGAQETDPDRPSTQRMRGVESMQDTKVQHLIPVLPKASCLFSDAGTPSYFGSSGEDAEEGYAGFSRMIEGDSEFRLGPDPTKGVDVAGGLALPEPNMNDSWKSMTPAASYTAYLNGLPAVGASVPGWARDIGGASRSQQVTEPSKGSRFPPTPKVPSTVPVAEVVVPAGGNPKEDRDALLARIDTLMGRLEDLERGRKQDSQTEILMFVGTGLFLLFSFDLVARRR